MLLFRIHFFLTPRSGFSSSLLLSIQVFLPVIVFTFSFLTNAVEKLSLINKLNTNSVGIEWYEERLFWHDQNLRLILHRMYNWLCVKYTVNWSLKTNRTYPQFYCLNSVLDHWMYLLDCKTVRIFAYSSTREQSNKRCGTRLKAESETRERR